MKLKIQLSFIFGLLFLFSINTYAGWTKSGIRNSADSRKLFSQYPTVNSITDADNGAKKDSLPDGFTDDVMKDLRDENGKKISPEFEGDAFQQRGFNGFAAGDTYGNSVSSAGDVNGDGYDDIIIGAAQNNTAGIYAGRAYIYYGGINVNSIADVILTGQAANNYFGYSVSAAGDVNGDGYSDVIVGAYGYSANTGRAYIYYGGQLMNNVADVILTGETVDSYFGYFVSTAGDVNGDGYPDVIAGAFGYDTNTGRAYIYYGAPSMSNVADVVLTGETTDSYFGISVSTTGDLNGDGYSDVIVGASGYNTNTGRAYVYYGSTAMSSSADIIMNGETLNDIFGTSVSSAGDVNGDGYSDFIVGAYGYNSFTGRAYLFYGGSYVDDVADIIMTGETVNNDFGLSVSKAGDVNGDGYSDIIVGAEAYSGFTGRSYIFFGGSSMNNVADLTMTGENNNSYFGVSVSSAGDANGDGYADVIVGAFGFNSLTGKSYLYMYGMNGTFMPNLSMSGAGVLNSFGQSVSKAGDVNGDGFDDVIVGAPGLNPNQGHSYIFFGGAVMDNIADVTMTGEAADNRFGQSVSGAGDVNGDGYPDVIVGADGYSSFRGRAYVFYGGASMNNVADVILTGEAANNYFGDAVSGAGDVNGDGYTDVIVGADGYSSLTGRAYVFYGGSSMNNVADVIMTGETTNNYFGLSTSSAGDLNGDGYDDIIIGAYRYNNYTGRAYIYYGGSNMNNAADVIYTGGAINEYFGCSVSAAGDVNGDGFADAIVGSFGYNSNTGRAYIYSGGYVMPSSASLTMSGEGSGYSFGSSVSSAGDINGDGYSDVIVSAPGGSTITGKAYVYYGGSSMNNSFDVYMTGEAVNNSFGNSVSSAGDLNSDGSPDLIVGAYAINSITGKSYIYMTSSPNVHPNILSVTDIPSDQGGYVYIKWTKSSYDIPVNGLVTNYLVERSIPPGIGGYQWVSVGTVPSTQNTIYNFEARTPSDNSVFFFRVTALTNTVSEKWRSNILSGSSLDNLAPLPPANLAAMQSGNSINLSWNQNSETDLRQYIIYRNDIQIGTSLTLNFTDNSVPEDSIVTYTIAAEDIHGNISGLSNPAGVNFLFASIDIKVIPQGFYNNGTQKLNMRDTVRAYLHSIVSPYYVVDSSVSVIDSITFTGLLKFSSAPTGTYYIVAKHRNSVETWSKPGGESIVIGNTVSYDFSNSLLQAYGNNLKQVDNSPNRFAVYSGDVNQDGFIDLTDLNLIFNDANNFLTGYLPTDVTGDGYSDLTDLTLTFNNSSNFVSLIKP